MAGLARMANRDHRWVEIQPGDTVIVSASPIPGNEEVVGRTIDNLFKVGANVFYHDIKRAHVSGHASQEELKLMLNLTRPKHFIPIHGEFRMLVQHGRLAAELGVAPDNIFIIENGQPIEFAAGRHGASRDARSRPGYVYVDGLSVGEVGDVVLRDRRALANDGMFLVVVTVDKQTGNADRPAGDRHPRLRGRRGRPGHRRGRRAGRAVRSRTRATTSARSRCSRRRSRTASRSTCTSGPSAGRWSSRSWSRSERGHAGARPRDTVIALALRARGRGRTRDAAAAACPPHVVALARRAWPADRWARSRSSRCSSRGRASSTATCATSCGRPSARARGCWPLLLIVAGMVVERPAQLGHGSALAIVGGAASCSSPALGSSTSCSGRGDGQSALRDGGGRARQRALGRLARDLAVAGRRVRGARRAW